MTVDRGLDVVGMPAGGWSELGESARSLIATAEVLLGGRRHLDLLPAEIRAERVPWPSPLRPALPGLLRACERRRTVVLASGDPLVSGVGTTLIELLGADAVRIHPAVSSVALAGAAMGWSSETARVISAVGRDLDLVRRELGPGQRLIVLSSGAATPTELAGLLVGAGYGASVLTVLGDLGSAAESRRTAIAADAGGLAEAPALNVVALECVADPATRVLGSAAGLPDDAYAHDGQLTKRDLRASALARLAPVPGELLWDLGAGAGSIAIEWARTDPRCRAIAVDRVPERAARIAANAARLGVPGVQVVTADAADALDDLPAPNAIFIGGGADAEVLDRCWRRLPTGGRLVAHAVTVETEQILIGAWRAHGGELVRIGVERLAPLGGLHGWQPARPVVQWSARADSGAEPTPDVDSGAKRGGGVVHFIGAGPGAADLLTVRATRLIASSPVCVYAGTYLDADVLDLCPAGATVIDSSRLSLDEITGHLVAAHRAGQDVARLCSGDPSIYSALAEQARRLDRAGVPWDVTPGVPAYAAAAAIIGRELTVPGLAQTVILTRAQAASTAMPGAESLERLAATGATIVLHLAIRRARELAERLAAHYGDSCPVAVVSRASQPAELVLRGTLADIGEQVESAGLRQAAVIIVGPALAAEGFVDSHLYGTRIANRRSADES